MKQNKAKAYKLNTYLLNMIFASFCLTTTQIAFAGERVECLSPQYVQAKQLVMDDDGKEHWEVTNQIETNMLDINGNLVSNPKALALLNSPTKSGVTVGIVTLGYKVYWERYKDRAREFTITGSKDPKDDIETSFYGRVTGFTLNPTGDNLYLIEGTNNSISALKPSKEHKIRYVEYVARSNESGWNITDLNKKAKGSDGKEYELWEVRGLMQYYDKESAKILGKGKDYGPISMILECKRSKIADL